MVYGEYPKTMQNIVKDRLPKFSEEEVKMVKGSIDFVGINQYTANYIQHRVVNNSMPPGYQNDWQVSFVCKFFCSYALFLYAICNISIILLCPHEC